MGQSENAYRDWKKGEKYSEIAKKYEVSESTVGRWIRICKQAEGKEKHKTEAEKTDRAEGKEKGKLETEEENKAEGKEKGKLETEEENKAEGKEKGKLETEEENKAETKETGRAETEEKNRAETEEKNKAETEEKNKAETEEKNKAEIKNNSKLTQIYEKLLGQHLLEEEQFLISATDFDEIKECIKILRLSDIQIINMMSMIQQVRLKETKEDITAQKTAYELILKYNAEIEKAKREKMHCVETLIELGQESKKQKEAAGSLEQEAENENVKIYIPDNQRDS